MIGITPDPHLYSAKVMRALVSFALVCATCAAADIRPDFSGSWKLNVRKSDVREPQLQGAVFKIVHREPVFVISRTLLYATETKDLKIDLRTDGRPVVVAYGEENLRVALKWEDGSLLCSIGDAEEAEDAADRVRYSLSVDRKTLTVTENAKVKPRIWVFQKE
jgi:hypothetical protein